MSTHAMRRTFRAFGLILAAAGGCATGDSRLSREEYRDRCAGAWAGQMIGVCYGESYQFQSNGKPITGPIEPWDPAKIEGALRQDDVYVEQTFLAAIQKHGLDITPEQAGLAFAATTYPLWHANYYGRTNVRRGIMPPMSGNPRYNRHCDDIDFQIEADVLGIVAPGMPGESNRLCDVFGHVMNYGDGVYGGMFVAGMYAEAFFESRDVMKVVRAGLACIPRASQYHRCITDTIRACQAHPDDWLAAWHEVERRWNDDLDCIPGNPHNIDARLNGAYIVIGLYYGRGDLLKTIEICTRCGQDADSSTSNAGGVVGCMKGYKALGRAVEGIPAIADRTFLGSDYSFNTLVPACEAVAEAVVRRAGGLATAEGFDVVRQKPRPPAGLEQWTDEARMLMLPVTANEVALWDDRWQPVQAACTFRGGFYPSEYGRSNVLMIFPIRPDSPGAIAATLRMPDSETATLAVEVATETQHGDCLMRVMIAGKPAMEKVIQTGGEFVTETVGVRAVPGSDVEVRLEFHANDYSFEAAYIRSVELK